MQLGVGVGAGDLLQEGQELLVAMSWFAGASHGAGGDLQGGEQGGGPVAHIVVTAAFRRPGCIGSIFWVRSNAWMWDFSSTHNTIAFSGSAKYNPTRRLPWQPAP